MTTKLEECLPLSDPESERRNIDLITPLERCTLIVGMLHGLKHMFPHADTEDYESYFARIYLEIGRLMEQLREAKEVSENDF
jgi:hypothetical protein